jgi:hypothetical protein
VKLTVVEPDELLVAEVIVGAPGTVAGVTEADAVDESERATPLYAVAVNVYAVPFVSGEIAHDVTGALTVQDAPPGDAVIV